MQTLSILPCGGSPPSHYDPTAKWHETGFDWMYRTLMGDANSQSPFRIQPTDSRMPHMVEVMSSSFLLGHTTEKG